MKKNLIRDWSLPTPTGVCAEAKYIGTYGSGMEKSRIRGLSYRFGRQEHLKGRTCIREVFSKGKRFYCSGAKLIVLKNNLPINRICFTFLSGKKFGNAVKRNRAKRTAREAYRLIKHELNGGYDLILMINQSSCETGTNSANNNPANRNKLNFSLNDMIYQLRFLFKKAGMFNNEK